MRKLTLFHPLRRGLVQIHIDRYTNRVIASFKEEDIETSIQPKEITKEENPQGLYAHLREAIKVIASEVESSMIQELDRIRTISPILDTTTEKFHDEYERLFSDEMKY